MAMNSIRLSEPIIFTRLAFSLPGQSRQVESGATVLSIGAKADRIKTSARLFTGEAVQKIKSADAATRMALLGLAIGIPSTFKGSYVLPRKLLDRADKLLEAAKAAREELVIAFVADDYDRERERAKSELGTAFSEADYPPAEEAMKRFNMSWSYFALDVPEDLPAGVRERETQKLRDQVGQVATDCRNALRQGLAELITHLVERLKPDADGKTKRLNATTVENLRTFLDTVSARDITSDDELRKLSEQAKAVIGTATADDLRGDGVVAGRIRDGLAAVAEEVTKLVKVDGERQLNLDLE